MICYGKANQYAKLKVNEIDIEIHFPESVRRIHTPLPGIHWGDCLVLQNTMISVLLMI